MTANGRSALVMKYHRVGRLAVSSCGQLARRPKAMAGGGENANMPSTACGVAVPLPEMPENNGDQ